MPNYCVPPVPFLCSPILAAGPAEGVIGRAARRVFMLEPNKIMRQHTILNIAVILSIIMIFIF